MKKIKLMMFMFVIALLLASCEKPLKLQYTFKDGNEFKQTLNVKMDMTMTSQGQKMNTLTDMEFVTKYKVKKAGENTDLETSFEKISMDMEIMGQKMKAGSDLPIVDNPKTQEEMYGKMMNPMFKGMTGKPFTFTLDSKGKLIAVKGIENLYAGMVESLPAEQREQAKVQMQGLMNEDVLKSNFENSTITFPDKELKIGDTFEQKVEKSGAIAMTGKIIYTIKEVKADEVILDVKGNVESGSGEAKIAGDITGNLILNKETAWTKSGNITYNLKGTSNGNQLDLKMFVTIK